MNQTTYPNLKQSFLLGLFYFGSYCLFFLIAGLIPYPFLKNFYELYFIIIFRGITPLCILPLIIYVSRKSGIEIGWKVQLPDIQLILLLLLLAIAMRIVLYPLIYPVSFWNDLMAGKIKIVTLYAFPWKPEMLVALTGSALLTPILEEIFWRKLILGMLLKKYSPVVAITTSAVLFAGSHLRLNDLGTLIGLGLLLGVVYYRTNSLEASIFVHSFNNVSVYLTRAGYVESNGFPLLRYVCAMAICGLVICLIVKNLGSFRRAISENSIHEDPLPSERIT